MRVLLADDHPTILAGIDHLLRGVPRIQVVGTAGSGDALLELLARTRCDAVVTDYSMPGSRSGDGLTLLGFLRRRWPGLVIVLHTMIESPALLVQARRLGIRHMVSKADASAHLAAALHGALAGGDYLSPTIQATLGTLPSQAHGLSPREYEVIRLYLSGMSLSAIAAQLHRSKQTISTQKRSAMRKLGVVHEVDLVRAFHEHAELAPDPPRPSR